jgi:hypothetical protein
VPRPPKKRASLRSGCRSVFSVFCCCPADRTCPLHRLNRPADGCAADALCRRFAYFLPQSIRCLPFGLPRLRRAQLRDAPPAGKKRPGERGSWPVAKAAPLANHLGPRPHPFHSLDRHRSVSAARRGAAGRYPQLRAGVEGWCRRAGWPRGWRPASRCCHKRPPGGALKRPFSVIRPKEAAVFGKSPGGAAVFG